MQKAHEALMRDARSMADRANQAKSMFLAQVSHEIRTPLHGAIGHLELLTREDLSAPQRQRIELIRHAFDMLMSLVNDILDITKIESQSITLASEQLQVNELLEECAQLFAPLALDKGLQFRCLPDVALERPLRGDPRRLMQILQNLVGNAVKFTSTGSITLSTRLLRVAEAVSVVRFEVADTGIGVSSGARQRIFKSLQQADDSISQRFGGTGLGLSLCRRLAELMGGELNAASTEGQGSVFTLALPLGKAHASASEERAAAAPGSPVPPRRIVYIEDNAVNAAVMRGIVEQRPGLELQVCATGQAGLEALADRLPDLLLLDVQLPDINGLEVLRRLRQRWSAAALPVIVVSADALPEQAETSTALGALAYLTKPVDVAAMLTLLDQTLMRSPVKA